MGQTAPPPRKRRSAGGRPRNTGSGERENPRAEILAAALGLFAERGFSNTTMSAIAEAAGLQQSSLYYWFPKKESILQHVLSVNRVPLKFVDDLRKCEQRAAVKVFRILRYDTYQLCRSPIDFNEIERIGLEDPDTLGDFWLDYSKLQGALKRLLRAGVHDGDFKEMDLELTSLALLCLDEGIQKRFRTQRHRDTPDLPFRHHPYTAERYATFAATMALASILVSSDEVEKVQLLAAEFDDLSAAGAPGR